MYPKSFKWVNHVSIYRPRSRGHLASSKKSSGGFFIKESREKAFSHELLAISHDSAKWKIYQPHFRLAGAFRMTVRKFRMVVRNHFSHCPYVLQPTPILFHFAWLCEIEKYVFSTPLCNFSHFFIFNPSPPPSIKLQSLVQVHFIASFIMHLDHHQLHLFSSTWLISFVTNLSKSYLEITPKLPKTC